MARLNIRPFCSRSGPFLAVTLAACSNSAVMRRVAPPEVTEFAVAFIETLRAGPDSAVLARLTPRLQRMEGIEDSLAAARSQFAPGTPDHVELVNAQALFPSRAGATRRALAYELRTGHSWTIASLFIVEEFDMLFVDGVGVRQSPASLRTIHRFTLEGKTPAHLIMFAALVGVAAFSIIVAVLVLQTPMRRRWLWAAVALLGAGKFGFNWTTGETFTQILSIQLLGAGLYRPGIVGPWLLVVSFPAGALVALDRRRHALSASQLPAADVPYPPDAAVPGAASGTPDVQDGDHRSP